MSATTFSFILVVIIPVLFLAINFVLAPHNPYQEKKSPFECGYHGFLQTRLPFNVSFYTYAILFLLFDLEIFLVYPYAVSSYNNESYGLTILIAFLLIVTIGFVFEIGKGALNIYSKQNFVDIVFSIKKVSYVSSDKVSNLSTASLLNDDKKSK